MVQITAFKTRDALMEAAAAAIAESLENGLKKRGSACAALSGGSTPEPAYRVLAQRTGWNWNAITFALVDERFVPPNDDASNQKMIERALAPAFAQGAHFRPMYFAMPTAAESATSANILYENLHIDVALMGMGDDGHTASWFPGAQGLHEALNAGGGAPPVVAVHAPQAAGAADRITLTRAAIAKAGRVILLITGDPKRGKLEQALEGPVENAPVAALFSDSNRQPDVLWAP
jgi:6-phosphogluconolactonase